jgi:hypothetical protein
MKNLQFVLITFFWMVVLSAQPPRPAPTPNDSLNSIEVLSDNKVVFSIYAPNAEKVLVGGDFSFFLPGDSRQMEMAKDSRGGMVFYDRNITGRRLFLYI